MNGPTLRFGLVLVALLGGLTAGAQDDRQGLSHKKGQAVNPASGGPVTQAEALAVFQRAEKVLRSVVKIRGGSATKLSAAKAPVKRAQVIQEMDRLFALAKPAFKLTPKRVKLTGVAFTVKDSAALTSVKRLASWGFVARLGPIATSSSDTLSVTEFGDAIGFFLLRMSELTHMPSTKWSPYLQSGG
jgi:hypothetical protein